jgi:hypothetical protein
MHLSHEGILADGLVTFNEIYSLIIILFIKTKVNLSHNNYS